jgi:hypothetical protein
MGSLKMRLFSGIVMVLLVLVPLTDQLACDFCGPTPDGSFIVKQVPHSEDNCVLQDGFERSGASTESGEPIHIHFCLLHSTFVALESHDLVLFEGQISPYYVDALLYDGEYLTHVFHPPPLA